MAHNAYSVAKLVPNFTKDVFGALSDDEDGSITLRLIALLLFTVAGSILTTIAILRWSAKKAARQYLTAS